MKIVIDFDKQKIIQLLESSLKELTFFLYSWFTEEWEILGYILGIWHIMICTTIFICILLSHTIFPFTWFQIGCFLCAFFIWCQHIFLHVCVVFLAETHLTKNEPPLYAILYNLTSIKIEEYGLLFLSVETTGVFCLFLELVAKFSMYIFENYISRVP
jgi:hypothetical protein